MTAWMMLSTLNHFRINHTAVAINWPGSNDVTADQCLSEEYRRQAPRRWNVTRSSRCEKDSRERNKVTEEPERKTNQAQNLIAPPAAINSTYKGNSGVKQEGVLMEMAVASGQGCKSYAEAAESEWRRWDKL